MAAGKAHRGGHGATGGGGEGRPPAPVANARSGAPAAPRPRPSRRGRNVALFVPVAVVWVMLDLAVKAWFNQFPAGTVVVGPLAGLVRFRVAHNTGGAWGMFGDATIVLGVLSLAVCAGLLGYVLLSRRATAGEALGAALVFAGGLGNAVDRFTLGYVVDFIDPVFIDFPTFNVADIGVTCGFVIFFAALFLRAHREEAEAR